MSWYGIARSLSSAANAYERATVAENRQRAYNQAVQTVSDYERYLSKLISVHEERTTNPIDWEAITRQDPPKPPVRSSAHEEQALSELIAFRPGLKDKLLGRVEKRIGQMEERVAAAKNADDEEYQQLCRTHEEQVITLEQQQSLARRILAGELEAYAEAFNNSNAKEWLGEFGSTISINVQSLSEQQNSPSTVVLDATIKVESEEVIPDQDYRVLKRGGLSSKPMAKTKYYGLYQDYVCGAVLRTASELFALFPVNHIIVTATDMLVNSATGRIEDTPLVSVVIPREAFDYLYLPSIDPSDAMANFKHNMSFAKTKGFRAVKALSFEDLD